MWLCLMSLFLPRVFTVLYLEVRRYLCRAIVYLNFVTYIEYLILPQEPFLYPPPFTEEMYEYRYVRDWLRDGTTLVKMSQ